MDLKMEFRLSPVFYGIGIINSTMMEEIDTEGLFPILV